MARSIFVLVTGIFFFGVFLAARLLDQTALRAVILLQTAGIAVGALLAILGALALVDRPAFDPLRRWMGPAASISISLLSTLLALSAFEAYLAWADGRQIILPADRTLAYETTEFSYTVQVNSIGFRGDETTLRPAQGTCRIAAVGDSFTYGWGVENEQTWVVLLEEALQEMGLENVEVLNIGFPGWGPSQYVYGVQRARLLEPDLVLVAVLQFDDLHQSVQPILEDDSGSAFFFTFKRIREFLRDGLENLGADPQAANDVNARWRQEAQEIYDGATPEGQAFLDELAPEVQEIFYSGNLNPGIINFSLRRPGYFTDVLDPVTIEREVELLSARLAKIRADLEATPGVVLSVPYRYFTPQYLADIEKLGFLTDPALPDSSAPDDTIATAAANAGLPFVSVTAPFQELSTGERVFYEFDGHFTPEGHALYAQLLAERLLPEVETACGSDG